MRFVFYDTETTGTATDFDQVLQFAAIATDEELQELDRTEIRSRLEPHIIAHPGALLTNRITVQQLLDPTLPSHYEMVRAIRECLNSWSPAIFVGYNSLAFDEHLLRQAFFKCLYPPYLTNRPGNGRADAMTLVQIASAFVPECLTIPCDDTGKSIFKLDHVAPNNGFNHDKAHDAVGDVEATIHLARCVKERAPKCWERFVQFSSKSAVASFIEAQDGFLLTEFYWNKPYHYPVGYIATDPETSNVKLCLDLRNDPNWLNTLTDSQLLAFANKSPKPIRRVKTNSSPLIAPLDEVPTSTLHGHSIYALRERADQIRVDTNLQHRLLETFGATRQPPEESPYWEERLYGQFTSGDDEKKMEEFHLAEWSARAPIVESFADERLRHFGWRLLHAHCRDVLPDSICAEIDSLISGRLCDQNPPAKKWTSIPIAIAASEQMLATVQGSDAELLTGYIDYLTERLAALSRQPA